MTVAHSERAHSRLSPSGAKRFMACPGSIRLTDGMPDQSSVFAKEGTAAHELAELCMKTGDDPGVLQGRVINIASAMPWKIGVAGHVPENDDQFVITPDMVSAVRTYLEHVAWFKSHGYEISVEERLDMSHVVEGMSGTADLIAYSEKLEHLFVIDYKHGRGVAVEAQENPQLACYAIGAVKRYSNRPVSKITLTVVQPRASHVRGPIRSWETTPQWLAEFEKTLGDAAKLVEDPNAPLVPGDHCTFCKAAATCPALREMSHANALADFEVQDGVGPDTVAEWLDKVGTVEIWCKKVREFANAEAREGRIPTGYKFVEKRATRKFREPEKAAQMLTLGMDLSDDEIYTPRELLSVAKIEKVVGKKNMEPLKRFVTQQSSGLVLAPESDPRPAAMASAADEFDAQDIEE